MQKKKNRYIVAKIGKGVRSGVKDRVVPGRGEMN